MRGLVGPQPLVHAAVRGRLPDAALPAATCCRIAVVPSSPLLTSLKDEPQRAWYATAAVTDRLVARRPGRPDPGPGPTRAKAPRRASFDRQLPAQEAGLVQAVLKDPYHFDFLGLGEEAHERDIESALVRHITRFLLELGQGFAFVGRQLRLEVDGREFFLDLLFYHVRLKRYVVVELKASGSSIRGRRSVELLPRGSGRPAQERR
jgi:hypothetical protein